VHFDGIRNDLEL